MSKTLGFTFVLALATVGVAIASLVFSILIFNKDLTPVPVTPTPETVPLPPPLQNVPGCKVSGKVSTLAGWKSAADQLLRGINRGVDPCDDFYTYSCKSYLDNDNNPTTLGGESQKKINLQIADYLDNLNAKKANDYEKIAKTAYQLCTDSASEVPSPEMLEERLAEVQEDLLEFIQFPMFGFELNGTTRDDLFTKIGRTERQFLTSILLGSGASVDYKDNTRTAIYTDQPGLSYAREEYVQPKFISTMQDYANDIANVLRDYSRRIGRQATCTNYKTTEECIVEFSQWIVNLEIQIALASWDDTEMRNVKQQWNPFTIKNIGTFFKSIPIDKYILALTDGMRPDPFDNKIVIGEPSYFTWLDALLDSGAVNEEQLTNYLATMFLIDSVGYNYLGFFERQQRREADGRGAPLRGLDARIPSGERKGRGARKLTYKASPAVYATSTLDNIRHNCVEMLLIYLPYAPGYIYVKNLRDDKFEVQDDVRNQTKRIVAAFSDMIDSLDWMDSDGKDAAHEKSKQLLQNIGWPDWYEPFDGTSDAAVDKYHEDYVDIINAKTYWEASRIMKGGLETREFWRMLTQKGIDEIRPNFLQSPAMVNAWYQPERNSITFPLANMAPPYYSLHYPQAYNYAGQGGTGGHELTHGYDDMGVQFGPTGMLAECEFTHCSILDDYSRQGFSDMAQCVVQQFNLQCCPVKTGNVRCANGATTQGENIADIGGQQAAYRAYQAYLQEERNGDPEDLLPGLEDLTTNQVFWLSYGFSWCSKKTEQSLVSQLETDPHAPSICRVNQVMQDIPQFGRDFKCKRGSVIYPQEDDRCKVWVGF